MTANVNVTKVLFKRGNTVQNAAYTGINGEITVDTQAKTLRIHDGVTTGGNVIVAGGVVGSYSNTNAAAYIPTDSTITAIQSNITAANAAITALQSNASTQQTQINLLNANVTAANALIPNLLAISSNIIPSANVTYSLGSLTRQWKDLWVSNNTIYIGNVPITVSNGNLLVNGNLVTGSGGSGTDDVLRANVGAYQIFANANAATQATSINTFNANLGAYQTFANANAATQATSINTFNANLGAYQTFANSNAATQSTAIATLQTQVYANANVNTYLSSSVIGSLSTSGNLTVGGNLVVNGNSTIINTTSYTIEDNILQIADANPADTLDLGFVGHRTVASILQHTGLVRDASAGNWRLFSNVTAQPGNTVDFTNAVYDDLVVGNISANIVKNGNVWTFGTDGTTRFPTNITINYSGNDVQFPRIIADSGKAFSIQGQGNIGSAALAWTVNPDAAGQYAQVGVTKGGGDNLAKVVLQAQSNSGDAATAKTWRFDETGATTFPDSLILAPVSQSITMQSDQYSQLMWENANLTVAPNMAINSNFYVSQNNATLDIAKRDGSGTQVTKSWYWNADGTLTLPTAGRINFDYLSISSDANVSAFYAPAGNVQLAAGIGDAQIVANSLNDSKTWTFGGDGILTIPGNTVTSMLYTENSGYRLVLEGNNSDVTTAKLELDNDNGHIRLKVGNVSTPATWAFRDNGNLTLPETGYLRVGSGIVAGFASSPAPVISGFSSISAENFTFLANGVNILSTVAGTYGNTQVAEYLPTYSGNVRAEYLIMSFGGIITTGASPAPSISGFRSISTAGNAPNEGNISASGNLVASRGAYITGNVTAGNLTITGNLDQPNRGFGNGPGTNLYITAGHTQGCSIPGGNTIISGGLGYNGIAWNGGNVTLRTGDYYSKQWNFDYAGNLTIPGNINFANGVNILSTVTGSYGNTQVAAYLLNFDGDIEFTSSTAKIGNVDVITVGDHIRSPAYQFSNGVNILTTVAGTYANANVASYLPTYSGNVRALNFVGAVQAQVGSSFAYALNAFGAGSDTGGVFLPADVNSNAVVAGYTIVSNAGVTLTVTSASFVAGTPNFISVSTTPTASSFVYPVTVYSADYSPALPLSTITVGNATISGNVTAPRYLFANGVNILSTVAGTYGNTQVASYLLNFDGDIEFTSSTAKIGNVDVITVGDHIRSPAYQFSNGVSIFSGITGTYSNTNVASYLTTATITTTGNITAGNLTTSGTFTVANITTTGAYGNITGANVISANTISATNYLFANGVNILSTVSVGSTYSNANVVANLANYVSNIVSSANVTASYFIGNGSALTGITANNTGNIYGTSSNVTLVAGSYSSVFGNTGMVTMPNVTVSGNVTIGNVTTTMATNGYNNWKGNTYANVDNISASVFSNGAPAFGSVNGTLNYFWSSVTNLNGGKFFGNTSTGGAVTTAPTTIGTGITLGSGGDTVIVTLQDQDLRRMYTVTYAQTVGAGNCAIVAKRIL